MWSAHTPFFSLKFLFFLFSVFGEWRGSCRKSHFPCPRFLPLSLFIVFQVCVFRARTERPVTDPNRGVCFPRVCTRPPSQSLLWRELECAAKVSKFWRWGKRISKQGEHRRTLEIYSTCPPHEDKSRKTRPSFKTLPDEPYGCAHGIAATWWQCTLVPNDPRKNG